MKIAGYFAFLILLLSCNERGKSPISEKLKSSDSVVVQFYGEQQVLENAATSAEPAAIKQLIRYIDNEQKDSADCAKGGQIIFYFDKKEIQRVIYKPACKLFEFSLNGKKQYTEMSDGAIHFINSIKSGQR
jgi:hypothetical protein